MRSAVRTAHRGTWPRTKTRAARVALPSLEHRPWLTVYVFPWRGPSASTVLDRPARCGSDDHTERQRYSRMVLEVVKPGGSIIRRRVCVCKHLSDLVCNARYWNTRTMTRDQQRGDRRVVQVPEFNLLSRRYSSISLWCAHLTGATFL